MQDPFEGKQFLVAVDTFSKWPEVVIMEDMSTDKTLDEWRIKFARWGIPQQIMSDNGPLSSCLINLNSLSEQATINTADKSISPCHKRAGGALCPIPKAGFTCIKEGEEITLAPCIQFLNTVPEHSTPNTGHHTSSNDDIKGPKMLATLAQA